MEESSEIFSYLGVSRKAGERERTAMIRTGSIMALPSSYMISINSLYHTSVNSEKREIERRWEGEKKIRRTMTMRDIHYRMYMCTFFVELNSTFEFFLRSCFACVPRCITFWTANGQAGRHGFRYLPSISQCNTSICTSIDSLMCQMKSGWKEKGYLDHQHLARIKSRFSMTDGRTKISSLWSDHRTDLKTQTIRTALFDQVTGRERKKARLKNRSMA